MSQTWVFRKDDYDKLVHQLKVLKARVEDLEKKTKEEPNGTAEAQSKT